MGVTEGLAKDLKKEPGDLGPSGAVDPSLIRPGVQVTQAAGGDAAQENHGAVSLQASRRQDFPEARPLDGKLFDGRLWPTSPLCQKARTDGCQPARWREGEAHSRVEGRAGSQPALEP